MCDPKIIRKAPDLLELEAGNYYWCKCGLSKKEAFCDGSHKETKFKPVPFTIEEKKKVAICQCKQTETPPFCDGTHRKL